MNKITPQGGLTQYNRGCDYSFAGGLGFIQKGRWSWILSLLARWQFAITTIYHFLFIPITLGTSLFLAVLETRYVITGDEMYKRMVKFWSKIFLINFAMGVVTGIVQEFHFGLNWSEYSRFVGDVIGVPIALDSLLAFFLESTFIGIWIFGWDKLSKKRMRLRSGW